MAPSTSTSNSTSTTSPSAAYLEEYNGKKVIAISVALMVLETLCVGLRLISRRLCRTAIGLDDWLIGPSFVFCFGLTVISICSVKYAGVGRHFAFWTETDPSMIVAYAKTLTIREFIYAAAFTLPRLSILAMYLRVFPIRGYRVAVYILALMMVMLCVAAFFTSFFKCRPLAYSWDKSIPGGHCINVIEYYRWITFPNILIDAVILVLPLPVIWGLHASKDQKIGLTVTFLTSSLGLVASIARFIIFHRSDAVEDRTWASADLTVWTSIESGVYLMAACFPTYRPLIPFFRRSVSYHSFLGRSLKQDTRDVDLQGMSRRRSGTTRGRGIRVDSTLANDEIFGDEGDQNGLVNCYRGDGGSAEVRSEPGSTAEGLELHNDADHT